jgi:predicted  nucleic acid-binding Zn-ribbon protein
MSEQSNSSAADQSTSLDGKTDSVGQAILGLLNTAADKAEADAKQALEAAQKLSGQLNAAQGRIADLEAEVRLYREKAERAEVWLSRIVNEIENRLINQPEENQRLH